MTEPVNTAAGVLVLYRGERRFVPAEVALGILPRPVVSRVPGSGLGMALVSGRVVPVVDLGHDRRQLLLCDFAGEAIGLGGLELLGAGFFDRDGEAVRVGAERILPLDVGSELFPAGEAPRSARGGRR
jgi:hypothetical protein